MTAPTMTIRESPAAYQAQPLAVACPRCGQLLELGEDAVQRLKCQRCWRGCIVERATVVGAATQRFDSAHVQVIALRLTTPDGQTGSMQVLTDTPRAVTPREQEQIAIVRIGRVAVALHNLTHNRRTPLISAQLRLRDQAARWLYPLAGATGAVSGYTAATGWTTGELRWIALATVLGAFVLLILNRMAVCRYQRRRCESIVIAGYAVASVALMLWALPTDGVGYLCAGVGAVSGLLWMRFRH